MSERELALADIRRAIYLHEYNPEALMAQIVALAAPPVGVSPQQVQRFDLVSVNFAYTSDHEMERADDGEWVRFDDVFPLTSLSPVEPKPPVHNDLCSWCLTQADHVAASEECYERNSERGRSVPKPPVEPTPSAGSQTAEKDRALIAACAPYLKDGETPAQCIARNRADIDVVLTLLAQAKQTGQHLATCATNGHIYGSTDACIFCGEAKSAPVEPTSEPTPDAQVCVWLDEAEPDVQGVFRPSCRTVKPEWFSAEEMAGWKVCPYCGKRLVVGTAPQGGEQ